MSTPSLHPFSTFACTGCRAKLLIKIDAEHLSATSRICITDDTVLVEESLVVLVVALEVLLQEAKPLG